MSGFPRVCGDVSTMIQHDSDCAVLSPRMRGCFFELANFQSIQLAFPAYAGMFPKFFQDEDQTSSFPRVCGDVSHAGRG